jgi:Protein of unknown function (DUF2924)
VDPTADLLVKLPSLNKPRLRELWQNSFNRPASPRLRRELMLPILAFRIQERSQGGLTTQTQAKLAEAIGMLNTSTRTVPRRFRPGTRIVREWKGKVHEVTITDGGFEYEGETFKSLSPIACRITGTHWSGPAFFGTMGKKQ